MRNRDFNDSAQAQSYMSRCIIRVNEEPAFVHQVGGTSTKLTLSYSPVDKIDTGANTILMKDKAVDMNPVPLGMCSYFDTKRYIALFLSRVPARMWRVGLSMDNICVQHILGRENGTDYREKLFYSGSMVNCIKGKYLGQAEIGAAFKNYIGSIPFSRRFAITSAGSLAYKTIPVAVGTWAIKKGPKLDDEFKFLQEALDEDIH